MNLLPWLTVTSITTIIMITITSRQYYYQKTAYTCCSGKLNNYCRHARTKNLQILSTRQEMTVQEIHTTRRLKFSCVALQDRTRKISTRRKKSCFVHLLFQDALINIHVSEKRKCKRRDTLCLTYIFTLNNQIPGVRF